MDYLQGIDNIRLRVQLASENRLLKPQEFYQQDVQYLLALLELREIPDKAPTEEGLQSYRMTEGDILTPDDLGEGPLVSNVIEGLEGYD